MSANGEITTSMHNDVNRTWQAAQATGLHTNRKLHGHPGVPVAVKFAYTRISVPPQSRSTMAHRVSPAAHFRRLYHQRPNLVVSLLLAFAYTAGLISSSPARFLASLLVNRFRRAVVRLLYIAPDLKL